MEGLDYWRLCEELSVIQAALLVVGCDPSSEDSAAEKKPVGYEAAKTAISNALRQGAIAGQVVKIPEYDINGNPYGVIEDSLDVAASRVEVESLREWLAARGFKTGFFFPEDRDLEEYLDPKHPRYAPKLAAAVHACRTHISGTHVPVGSRPQHQKQKRRFYRADLSRPRQIKRPEHQ